MTEQERPRRTTVVGGGITGLAAAWEAVGRGDDVRLLEASDRLGGLIHTSEVHLPDGDSIVIDEVEKEAPEGFADVSEILSKHRRARIIHKATGQWPRASDEPPLA